MRGCVHQAMHCNALERFPASTIPRNIGTHYFPMNAQKLLKGLHAVLTQFQMSICEKEEKLESVSIIEENINKISFQPIHLKDQYRVVSLQLVKVKVALLKLRWR